MILKLQRTLESIIVKNKFILCFKSTLKSHFVKSLWNLKIGVVH